METVRQPGPGPPGVAGSLGKPGTQPAPAARQSQTGGQASTAPADSLPSPRSHATQVTSRKESRQGRKSLPVEPRPQNQALTVWLLFSATESQVVRDQPKLTDWCRFPGGRGPFPTLPVPLPPSPGRAVRQAICCRCLSLCLFLRVTACCAPGGAPAHATVRRQVTAPHSPPPSNQTVGDRLPRFNSEGRGVPV